MVLTFFTFFFSINMVKSARAKAAEKAAEKVQNDQMYFNIKYPMTNQAVINFGQCRICGVEVEINVPNDVDVLGKHYTTNHQVFDVVVDKGSKIRRVHQERNSLAAEGNCIFLVSIKNKWSRMRTDLYIERVRFTD